MTPAGVWVPCEVARVLAPALLVAVRRAERDGAHVPVATYQVLSSLVRAATAPLPPPEAADAGPVGSPRRPLGVTEAAGRLGCTARRVRQLASEDADAEDALRLRGVKVGVVWCFDAAEIERLIYARTRRRHAQVSGHRAGGGRHGGA